MIELGVTRLARSLLSMSSGVLLASSCSVPSSPPPEPDPHNDEPPPMADAGRLGPCEQAFGNACGTECAADSDCAEGLHCADERCTVHCFDDEDCSFGTCTERGACREDEEILIDPPETHPDAGMSTRPECVEGQVEFTAVVPQVWMLLDRSGSMTGSLGAVSRWDALGSVLLGDPADPMDRGVVGDFEDRIAFGAVFYTTGNAAAGCALDLETVALASNSYTAIRQRYNKLGPTGGTPTADSVAATMAVAASSDLTGGPKILVLATDGAPGACSQRADVPTAEVEREVQKAFAKRIQTFAVSIATGTDVPHMQRVANLGVGLPADANPPAPYYTAESQEELKQAFGTILEDVPRTCVFALNGEVDAKNAGEGTVTLAGEELIFNDMDGWVLKRPDQVELIGEACARIQAGEEDLDISFPCRVFKPTRIR